MMAPLEITLEFMRAEKAGDPHGVDDIWSEYIVRIGKGEHQPGEYQTTSLRGESADDNKQFLDDLAAVRSLEADPEVVQRVGHRLRRFLQPADWRVCENQIAEALESGQPVNIIIISQAAEIHRLPWPLLTFKPKDRPEGALSWVLLRDAWPDVVAADASPEAPDGPRHSGRILVAYSGAGDEVPSTEHRNAIADACKRGDLAFDAGLMAEFTQFQQAQA